MAGPSTKDAAAAMAQACAQVGVPGWVLVGIYGNESTFGTAYGPGQNTYGYMGLTAGGLWNPSMTLQQDMDTAAKVVRTQYDSLGHSWMNALAAYNAGPGAYQIAAAQQYAANAVRQSQSATGKELLRLIGAGGTPGGAAGTGSSGNPTGGTGTSPQGITEQPFVIDANTDYWSGCSQLAQQAQLYFFADGETVYLLDGPNMVAQEPACVIDASQLRSGSRVGGARRFGRDAIVSLDASYDNTAYEWTSTHKRRGVTQGKSPLARVQSPTEVQVGLICPIDYIRAGDTVYLAGLGPMDGIWVVGDCTRSVFQPSSTLTLVPAMAPIPEYEVAGVAASRSGNRGAGGTPTGKYTGYVNPFPDQAALSPERIDMGVDYNAPAGSKILAIGDAVILPGGAAYGGTGWDSPENTQAGVYYKLLNGQMAGKSIYVTEDIVPHVASGQHVKAGDVIATFKASPTGLETGWGSGQPFTALAAHLGQQKPGKDPGGWASEAGGSFNAFLISLGCKSGVKNPGGIGPVKGLPADYPTPNYGK